jgi:adenylate cyclase
MTTIHSYTNDQRILDFPHSDLRRARAAALAPGAGSVHMWYAMVLNWAGRPEEAIPLYQKAIRLNPGGSTSIYLNLGSALRMTGKYEEAVSAFRESIQRSPDNILGHIGLATVYSMLGREKEARAEAAEVLRINPKF